VLTTRQFERTRNLALRLAGIALFERHRELLQRRSRRQGIADTAGWDLLLGAAEAGEAAALRRLVSLVTTNFTGFFRHAGHFDVAAQQALRAVEQRGRARIWSAAAATGEEPYSLAMRLMEVFERDDPPVMILASDIDAEALSIAETGDYGDATCLTIQPERRARFFSPTPHKRWRLAAAVRRLVTFKTLNLIGGLGEMEGPFDVIFCRNVLIYLEAFHRQAVLVRLASLLAPDGLLILDPVEDTGQARQLFAAGKHGIHILRPTSPARLPEGRTPTCQHQTSSL
jgi:chemotaxis protein methyltransferase CheR